MPRERGDSGIGASERPALRSLRDDDFEDIVAAFRYLPTFRRTEGTEAAIAVGQTELRSLVDLMNVARPRSKEEANAATALYTFFEEADLRLMSDGDHAGYAYTTAVLTVILRERYAPAVRAVFERSPPSEGVPYVPNIPRDK